MGALAMTMPHRRGACPGLSTPMPTGDGLLVRLTPTGTMPLAAFCALAAAARSHGNGVMEITARGNIQIRGLTAASAPRLESAIAGLDIAAEDGIPVVTNPLAGLDPDAPLDGDALAVEMRRALARKSFAAELAPKVSIIVDDGGTLGLDTLAADFRFCAETTNDDIVLRVSTGGDGASAIPLGAIRPLHGVETAMRLLEVLARRGRNERARDMRDAAGLTVLRAAVADRLLAGAQPNCARDFRETIGIHRLRGEALACGIGIAFGHTDATSLERLAETAMAAGATGLRAAPGRSLMVLGLTGATSSAYVATAERLGFIVRADDPRRHVVACAGAPVCASAQIASRALGPLVAAGAAAHIDGSFTIHISGCRKGCAHPAPAAVTVVGAADGCGLVVDGTAGDAPRAVVATDAVPATIIRQLCERRHV